MAKLDADADGGLAARVWRPEWPSTPMSPPRISAAFSAAYDIGELLSYKGIAEGVENSNFLVHTEQRQLHPDAL